MKEKIKQIVNRIESGDLAFHDAESELLDLFAVSGSFPSENDIENAENVVVSGSLTDWGDELIQLFTLAVRLETSQEIRIERLKIREREKFGNRLDPDGDMYQQHQKLPLCPPAYLYCMQGQCLS